MIAEPADLLAEARRLVDRPDAPLEGCWPRATALLARQALEEALDAFWDEKKPDVRSVRAQQPKLLCLPSYLDGATARQAAHVWVMLSGACHHHAYDLPPTVDELTTWLDQVDQILQSIELLARD